MPLALGVGLTVLGVAWVVLSPSSPDASPPPSPEMQVYLDQLEGFDTIELSLVTTIRPPTGASASGRGLRGLLRADAAGRLVWDTEDTTRYSMLDGESLVMGLPSGALHEPSELQPLVPLLVAALEALRQGDVEWRAREPYDYGLHAVPSQLDYAEAVMQPPWATDYRCFLRLEQGVPAQFEAWRKDGTRHTLVITSWSVDEPLAAGAFDAEAPEEAHPGTCFGPACGS